MPADGGVLESVVRLLPPSQKQRAKAVWHRLRRGYVRRFRSYDRAGLVGAFRAIGLSSGDSVIMHSRLSTLNGFTGQPRDIIDSVRDVIGPAGTLLMVSLPYRSSTRLYLESRPRFDVRRTPSHMGLLTEIFRRDKGVLRSASPTHPVLAQGRLAEWFVAGHDAAEHPCGDDTPFSRLVEADARLLFFDLPLTGFTFLHYIEHAVRDELPFALYDTKPVEVPVIDHAGRHLVARVYPFSLEASARRRAGVPSRELLQHTVTRRGRIGNTMLVQVRAADALRVGRELARAGKLFDV
jgi:aminoglycoside 3-N-acetyltransferase